MKDFYFLPTHEWFNKTNNTIGISDYAQQEMGDIVFAELPEVGDKLQKGETFATIESVKAVSEVFSPVTAVVEEINELLLDNPESINEDAFNTWFVKVAEVESVDGLLGIDEYNKSIE